MPYLFLGQSCHTFAWLLKPFDRWHEICKSSTVLLARIFCDPKYPLIFQPCFPQDSWTNTPAPPYEETTAIGFGSVLGPGPRLGHSPRGVTQPPAPAQPRAGKGRDLRGVRDQSGHGHVAPSSSKCATVSLPNGYRNWIQGGRASLSGGGPIRFPPSSPLGASVNPARRCGLTTHGRISDCRHGTARAHLAPQEGQSSIGYAAVLGGVSLELWPGRGASRVSLRIARCRPGPRRTTRHHLDAAPSSNPGLDGRTTPTPESWP